MMLFGLTDTGAVRQDNQDSYAIRELSQQLAVAVVCDGMGGAQAGNVASAVAVEAFADAVEEACLAGPPGSGPDRQALLDQACRKANRVVFELSEREPGYHGMGTTLVGALIQPGQLSLANIGDSRAYLLQGGGHPADHPGSFPGAGHGGPGRSDPGAGQGTSQEESDHPGAGCGSRGGGGFLPSDSTIGRPALAVLGRAEQRAPGQ